MQKIIMIDEAQAYTQYIEPKAANDICTGNAQTFESYKNYILFVFYMYDIHQKGLPANEIIIYMDHEDLFFLCESRRGYERVCELALPKETNEKSLWEFFQNLLKHDMDHLEDFECEIADEEMAAMVRHHDHDIRKIIAYRKELLHLKRYYEQLDALMDNLALNEHHFLTEDGVRHFSILANRTARYFANVLNLRDYVTQMREAYQAQIDIEQNNLMRLFTVITAVFLPLTLMVGWYGMNFKNMPELDWPYAYPIFLGVSVLVCAGLLMYFRKKKWF